MSNQKQILNLRKQNDGIITSLKSKGIDMNLDEYKLEDGIEEELVLNMIKKENDYLKQLARLNKPPAPVKEKVIVKEKVKEKELEEESYEDPVKNYSCITNMEDIKRAFFNNEYEKFEKMISEHNFKFLYADYKYSSDNDGKPDFIARNLLRGFVRQFDDYRKYFMIGFKCYTNETGDKYTYPSFWIVNTNDNINDIIGSLSDSFEFKSVPDTEVNSFLEKIKRLKGTTDLLIDESYVH
jgi:hypothetical protein